MTDDSDNEGRNYPDVPGWSGPGETSQDAAMSVLGSATTIRISVLACIECAQLTGDEILKMMNWPHLTINSVRSRCSELRRAGLIEDSGERRESVCGRKVIVWRLTEAGRAAAAIWRGPADR